MRIILTFLALVLFSSVSASEFCELLEAEGRKFFESEEAQSCEIDEDCSNVASDLLNCGCGGLVIGNGRGTYDALEKVHEEICGISCIPECIIIAHRSTDRKLEKKLLCKEKQCKTEWVESEH